ncbi:MAG: hypothetical protein HAW67_06935 [Endozoicomonadaceae bacterium]|nr:hypothetical protein [Endozoicomonadaceae bacterium]
MDKNMAKKFANELREKAKSQPTDLIDLIQKDNIEDWMFGEIGYQLAQREVLDIQNIYYQCRMNTPVYSLILRGQDTPPSLALAICANGGIDNHISVVALDNLTDFYPVSGYSALKGRCKAKNVRDINFCLDNKLYHSTEDLDKSYIEYVAHCSGEREQMVLEVVQIFSKAGVDTHDIKIFGKESGQYLKDLGYGNAYSWLLSDKLQKVALESALNAPKQEFEPLSIDECTNSL